MRRILLAIVLCGALLAGLEWWLHARLFQYASYSNSFSIDRQLQERNASGRWNQIFIGDSETRWGIHPGKIDEGLVAAGLPSLAFNHAFDGFGASWWPLLLPALLDDPSLHQVGVVALGVQLIDSHRIIARNEKQCGALQKPVLTSPFAIDLGVYDLCRTEEWDAALGRRVFHDLWLVRYSSAVRTAVLPKFMTSGGPLRVNSRAEGDPYHGFQPHKSIATEKDGYEQEFSRWKAQYDPARDFVPLPVDAWPRLVADGGYFDQLLKTVSERGRKLTLFALPTNPAVIDTFGRRADYARNSALLSQWAKERGVVYVDVGLRDVPDPDDYFSDMRHLSGHGAVQYSAELGRALAAAYRADPTYAAALSNGQ